MCQNQNIADSDAMIAHDLRRKVYQLVQQGKSRDEIISYMKQRYGDFVHYQPPVTPTTIWLWILPVIFVFIASVLLLKNRNQPTLSDEKDRIKLAEKLLEEDR